ncbi:unnamed protein product [Prunus armeniaca]
MGKGAGQRVIYFQQPVHMGMGLSFDAPKQPKTSTLWTIHTTTRLARPRHSRGLCPLKLVA